MNIPVLLEPIATGFRASTGAPLNLAAEAPTADEVVRVIESMIRAKQESGAKIVELTIPSTDRLRELAASMAANPCLPDLIAATKAYRQQREAEEDAEAAEQALSPANGAPNKLHQEPAA